MACIATALRARHCQPVFGGRAQPGLPESTPELRFKSILCFGMGLKIACLNRTVVQYISIPVPMVIMRSHAGLIIRH